MNNYEKFIKLLESYELLQDVVDDKSLRAISREIIDTFEELERYQQKEARWEPAAYLSDEKKAKEFETVLNNIYND